MTIEKDKLKQQVTEMEAKLAEMKELLNKPDIVISYWQPSETSPNYWYLSPTGIALCGFLNPKTDKSPRYRVFKTLSEALKYAEYVKAEETLKRVIAEANKGWIPDWSNHNEFKYLVTVSCRNLLNIGTYYEIKVMPNFMYIKTQRLAEDLMSKYRNEFLTYLSY